MKTCAYNLGHQINQIRMRIAQRHDRCRCLMIEIGGTLQSKMVDEVRIVIFFFQQF